MKPVLSRRAFLMTGAALGGTVLVAAVGGIGYLSTIDVEGLHGATVRGDEIGLNAFVVLHTDGRVVINVPRTEMGQGIHTGLAMMVAEEMDLPWDDRIRVEFPTEAHPAYSTWFNVFQIRPEEASGPVAWLGRRVLGQMGFIATGASGSTMGLWHPMRVAGAAARDMLVTAAATQLGVPSSDLSTSEGAVHHVTSGRSIAYGDLAQAAAQVPPPEVPRLKPEAEWRLIGRSQRRLDLPAKVRGEPIFGADVVVQGMLHATMRHAPVFGATVSQIRNEPAVRAAAGVIDVVIVDGRHVAVVAGSWWQAEQAAWLLDVEWTPTPASGDSGAQLADRFHAALSSEAPHEHIVDGDAEAVISAADANVVAADYRVPFVTHACMEPMNATAILHQDGLAEVWAPSQNRVTMQAGINRGMGWAGITPNDTTLRITMNGGAFGRRSDHDVVAEASFLAARHPGRAIKVMWSREEDIGRGLYRSQAAARLRAALGPDGLPTAYDARVASQSILNSMGGRNLPFTPSPDGDGLTVEGLDKLHYAIANRRIRSQHVPTHMPIQFWRSNGFSFNTFFTESFIDECAAVSGADPVDYRRTLLRDNPRHLAVLNRVAELAAWGSPMAPGRGRGIAIEECYRSVVAQVAEVTIADDGEITVDRIYCAADVGLVINPDQVIAQMEGGALFGVTSALMSAVTVDKGSVFESNFHDYPVQRLANAPEITVALIESELPPCGAGEPGVVPTAAAIANAIHAATGRRLRALPLAVTETVGERAIRTVLTPA
jgi:isoquinoline 1-oxidoreductase subunit beta